MNDLEFAVKMEEYFSKRKTNENKRTCELVKIVATSDIGKPLVNDNVTYLLDRQTMTVYAPWASYEMLHVLGLKIESEDNNEEKIL